MPAVTSYILYAQIQLHMRCYFQLDKSKHSLNSEGAITAHTVIRQMFPSSVMPVVTPDGHSRSILVQVVLRRYQKCPGGR